jgi:hypothetical protein
MSNIFGDSLLKDLFSETTNESTISSNLPKHIRVVDKDLKNSITSSFVPKQKGGAMSLTSSVNRNAESDVNQLISMLTTESNTSNVSTETDVLENRLKNMLQNGGSLKRNQYGGNDSELSTISNIFTTHSFSKDSPTDSSSILGNLFNSKEGSESSLFNFSHLGKTPNSTTSSVGGGSNDVYSATSSVGGGSNVVYSATSSVGGGCNDVYSATSSVGGGSNVENLSPTSVSNSRSVTSSAVPTVNSSALSTTSEEGLMNTITKHIENGVRTVAKSIGLMGGAKKSKRSSKKRSKKSSRKMKGGSKKSSKRTSKKKSKKNSKRTSRKN